MIDYLEKPHVFIVDDAVTNIRLLTRALKDDYIVAFATCGADAIVYLEEHLPDLILLDVMMPGINGFKTCARIKADQRTKDIPVIFITALDNVADKSRGFEAGGVDYITKPFEALEVKARVRTHIALRMAEKELKNQNRILEKKVKGRTRQLQNLLDLALLLNNERDLNRLFDLIISQVARSMGADRAGLFLLDQEKKQLWTKAAKGVDGSIIIPINKGLVGKTVVNGAPLAVADAYKHPDFDRSWDKQEGYRTKSVLCFPVRNRENELKGVLEILNKVEGVFEEKDLGLAAACAAQIGVAIETSEMVAELRQGFESFALTLARAIEAKHPITAGHSHRVTEYSLLLGRKLGLSDQELEVLKYAGLLHDIGKIGVPDSVLTKQGRFTDEDKEYMHGHTVWTMRILERIHLPRHLKDIPKMAACHHEKMDGTGYPYGLKGKKIPFFSRIMAVSDVFDALTSQRDYKKYDGPETYGFDPMTMSQAFEILERDQKNHFDRQVVAAALSSREEMEQLWLTLNAQQENI